MIYVSLSIDHLLAQPDVPVYYLTAAFFLVTFLAATQDIAVDGTSGNQLIVVAISSFSIFCMTGWGLELFEEPDRHIVSQCQVPSSLTFLMWCSDFISSSPQTVGIELGTFISYTIFTAFNSADFCNQWIRSIPSSDPMISVGQYLFFIGVLYLAVTVLILFKSELPHHFKVPELHVDDELTPAETYRKMWEIIQLPSTLPHLFPNECSVITFYLP